MRAEIITIGDEILIGQIVNTNSAWIADFLTTYGIECIKISTVRDLQVDILEAIDQSIKNVDLVIMTGGLGPTNDDITKDCLCKCFNDSLVYNTDVFEDISSFLKRKGREKILDLNKDQAMIPSKSRIIRNKFGTAPGLWIKQENKNILALPGVPYEMKALMKDFLVEFGKENKMLNIIQKTIFVRNIPESELVNTLKDWELDINRNIKLAYLPSPGLVRLHLSSIGTDKLYLEEIINLELEKLARIINYDESEIDLNQIVFDSFIKNNLSLSVAESCSSGLIAACLTSLPGSSDYFKGGVVVYNDLVKSHILDIDINIIKEYKAVSERVVSEMAIKASEKFKSDFSIATSGYAGPQGGTKSNPVGTVFIAIKSPDNVVVKRFLFSGERKTVLHQVKLSALEMLIQELKKYI